MASVTLFMNGTDVTQAISRYLLRLTYEDVESGETDSLTVELDDSKRLFVSDWFPTLGMTLSASIGSFQLGDFEIDEVTCSSAPSVCRIKAVSVAQESGLRQRDESKAWEGCKLSTIAKDIADASNVQLLYQGFDPFITRAEQGEQSRLAFLDKLCHDNYLVLKVAEGKLIIVDEEDLDKAQSSATLTRDASLITNFNLTASLQEVYRECKVSYRHGKKAQTFEAVATTGEAHGKTLKVNKRVESRGEAERLAKNELRQANKKKTRLRLEVVGASEYVAGSVITLAGFGFFDGRWLLERVRHQVDRAGWKASLEARQCQ